MAGQMGSPPPRSVARLERFGRVGSTQDIVRGWLADGQPEICVAVADQQTTGRGRLERRWLDSPGRGLLLSAGFRPDVLPVSQAWRLPAVAALAMLEAAAALLGRGAQRLALKWPNDIVAVQDGELRKVGGLLAEGSPEGQCLASSVVGVGINVDWPAADFPAPLATTMGSLREADGGRPVDREALLVGWLARLEPLYAALLEGSFDGRRWADAQVTTGALVSVETGHGRLEGSAVGVDADSGALLLREVPSGALHSIAAGDVVACRVGRSARPL